MLWSHNYMQLLACEHRFQQQMSWELFDMQAFTSRCLWWHTGLHVPVLTHCLHILLHQSVRAHVTKFPHHTQQAFMPCAVHE
jgi:hypothetical protein